MVCYQKAAELGDVSALNSIGLMLEQGYEEVMPSTEAAVSMFKQAHNYGNTDASINLAIHYLRESDFKVGKALLVRAYANKNARAVDCMLQHGIIKSKSELETFVQQMLNDKSDEGDSVLQSMGLLGSKRLELTSV